MSANGRAGRFLTNLMLGSGNYSWTMIRVDRQAAYMAALEQTSVHGKISDLAKFVDEELSASATLKHARVQRKR